MNQLARPRLKRSLETVDAGGDVIFMRAVADDVRVVRPSVEERELIRALDGETSVEDLVARFGAPAVAEVVDQMQSMSLIEDAVDDDAVPAEERERFDRQLRYFSDVSDGAPTPSQAQARLRRARVAVLGVGGLGGRTAWELACCGVGELRLIDGDLVETSNLDRQIQYTEADVGRRKVEVTAARLRAFNSAIRVEPTFGRIESEAELADYIQEADLVVDAADWPAHEFEFWCNAACFAAGIPYIAMSQLPPLVRVGPLYVPGKTGCYACQDIRYRREYPLYDVAIDQRRATSSPAPSLGPPCGVIGGLVAMDVVHQITGLVEPATLGVGHSIDLRTMEVEREPIVPEASCPVCAGPRTNA
ncbi:MAG TPA: TOMM precursor leader peptide-binding protein [Solirubrobacterales bacterium]|nr:TOMM precursor leader peptide-binding protein [Solirubrobacterales bacterium]